MSELKQRMMRNLWALRGSPKPSALDVILIVLWSYGLQQNRSFPVQENWGKFQSVSPGDQSKVERILHTLCRWTEERGPSPRHRIQTAPLRIVPQKGKSYKAQSDENLKVHPAAVFRQSAHVPFHTPVLSCDTFPVCLSMERPLECEGPIREYKCA